MWLTDRTRYLMGLQECQMKRYLTFHTGGTGLVSSKESILTRTGTAVHKALEMILTYHQENGACTREEARKCIAYSTSEWEYHGLVDLEQRSLVHGISWAWYRLTYPIIAKDLNVLYIEHEELLIAGCSCGQGQSPPVLHHPSCRGVAQMSRPDLILEEKLTGIVSNHDLKTAKSVTPDYLEAYRDSVQMAVGTAGVEARTGKRVEQYYIHALEKGGRGKLKSKRGSTSEERQYSNLLYVNVLEYNPPINPSTALTLEGFWYNKKPIWDVVIPDAPPDVTNEEYLVYSLPESELAKTIYLVGPYQRQSLMIQQYFRSMYEEETRWQEKVKTAEADPNPFSTEAHQHLLDKLFPRSYNCHMLGSRCPHYTICLREKGWTDPMGSGLYKVREPHHPIENSKREI